MKKAILMMGLVVCSCVAVVAMPKARSAAPAPTPAPAAKSASELVLDQWNDIGRKLTAMAEDFPEDKYEFKPTKEQRTFAGQLIHAAGSMYFFTDPADGKKPRYNDDPKRDELKSKAQIVAFVKKSVEDGRNLIKAKGDKGMMEVVDAGNGQMAPVRPRLRPHRALRRTLRPARGVLPRGRNGAAGIASEKVVTIHRKK